LEKSLRFSFSNIKYDIQRTERILNELSSIQNEQSSEIAYIQKALAGIKRRSKQSDQRLKRELAKEILSTLDLESRLKQIKSELKSELQQQFVSSPNEHSNEQSKGKIKATEAESSKPEVFVNRSLVRLDRSSTVRSPTNNEHSDLHIEILRRIMLLQNSLQLRWISMKELASEIYPGRHYRRVKSTLSEYLTELGKDGLIEKQYQRRNRLFVSFTKKALNFAEVGMLAKMRSLISRK